MILEQILWGHSRANSRLLVLLTVSSLCYSKRMSLLDDCTIPLIGKMDDSESTSNT